MRKQYFIFLIIWLLLPISLLAQSGGTSSYYLLQQSSSPRLAAMGVDFTSIYDNDLELVAANPSLINSNMNTALSAAFVDYLSDIKFGQVSYSHTFDKAGSFAGTIIYANYPNFTYAESDGIINGQTFSANEAVAVIGWGRSLTPRWSIGANFKMLFASYEQYGSFGLAVDVAGTYRIEEKSLDMSLIVRNLGAEIVKLGDTRNNLPFEIQYALSHKLKHLPFRFTVLLHDLQRWNLRYDDPTLTSNVDKSKFGLFADNLFRHVAIGGEFTIAKIIFLRLGYDYQVSQEMKLSEFRGLNGFSFGLGINIYKFEINYAHSAYTIGNSKNYVSVKTKISDWAK
ncbi:type IX secretion system protein PorQ [Bacteroidales bacterium OttesenSCG-928-L14]|nr:type IX secretion system protein PorQ [Bacteroidales bacterium OttesenSCG-928-L14]